MSDLDSAEFLTIADLDFFLFHRATDLKGNIFPYETHNIVAKQSKRIGRLFRDAVDANRFTSIQDPIAKSLKFPKMEVMEWLRRRRIIESIFKAGIRIERSKFEIFKKYGVVKELPNGNLATPSAPIAVQSQPVPAVQSPEKETRRGRKRPAIAQAVVEEARRIRKQHPAMSLARIVRQASICKLLNRGAKLDDLKTLSAAEYKKRFGKSPRTIENWIFKAIK
jgi:hypothetical protein